MATHLVLILMSYIHNCYISYCEIQLQSRLTKDIPEGNYNRKGKHSRIAGCVCVHAHSIQAV